MTPDELKLRQILVSASGAVYWLGVILQARRIRRRIGRSPNLRPRGTRERVLWFGWFLVIAAWIGLPWLVRATGPRPGLALLPSLLQPAGLAGGIALLALGYAATLWCYAAMGDRWRIGINAREKPTLVRSGPYRWVRHPIYSLQIVMLAGAALLLPTLLTFAVLALHGGCVLFKARDEEHHLVQVLGADYADYAARTGRFVPRRTR